jgi:alkylhydroperoxidase family enzyme
MIRLHYNARHTIRPARNGRNSSGKFMARVRLLEEDEAADSAEFIEKVRRGRRGNLLNIYRLLLHSPPLASAWFDLLNAVRWKTKLDGRLREIVIIRIAYLNHAQYCLAQHIPALALPDGMTLAECDALTDWRATSLFSDSERAALAFTDAMTRDIKVPGDVFADVRRHFDERQIVELSVLIGAYNMHTRVQEALQVDREKPQT